MSGRSSPSGSARPAVLGGGRQASSGSRRERRCRHVMAVRYLDAGQLRSLGEAAIDLGLHERRDVLLAPIDRRFTSTLKRVNNPRDQLRLDLEERNRTEKLSDGTVP